MIATERSQRPGIQSVERAAAILRLLSGSSRRLAVIEIAQALSLHKATVHGILRTLRLYGFVEQDHESRRYQLGATLLALGFAHLECNRLRTAALNPAEALAVRTGHSVRVAMLLDRQALIIHHIPVRTNGHHGLDVGRLTPLHATALGKALLSQRPRIIPELAVGRLQPFTGATITNADRLRRVIAEIPRRGWAGEVGEHAAGVASIAAPIVGSEIAHPGAIAIDGPVELLCQRHAPRSELIEVVRESGRAVAVALGTESRGPDAL